MHEKREKCYPDRFFDCYCINIFLALNWNFNPHDVMESRQKDQDHGIQELN